MAYINKYANRGQYDAAASARPAGASSVSAIGPDVAYDGINVVAPMSERRIGDHAFLDKETGAKVVIRGGTLRPSLLDSDRYVNLRSIFIGRYAGKNIFVDYDQIAAANWATPDEWTLSGFDLSASGSATILAKYYSAAESGGQTSITLSWAANASIDTLVATLNATSGFKSYCKAYKVNSTTIGVTVSGYSSSIGLTVSSGDITATRTYKGYQYTQYTSDPRVVYNVTTIVRHNGDDTSGSAFVCFDKMYDYYYASGAQTTETLDGAVVRYSAFNTTTNPTLYALFGGDYLAYMKAKYEQFRVEYPCNRLAISQLAIGDGCTAALAAVTHTDFLGNTVHDFPQHVAAKAKGVSVADFVTGFEPGSGHLGGTQEAKALYNLVERNSGGLVNVSLAEGGGTVVNYATTTWLAFPSGASFAWVFRGYGSLNSSGYGRCYAIAARVFRAFSDSEL